MPPIDFAKTFKEVKQNVDYLQDSDPGRDLSSEIKYVESKFAQDFKSYRDNIVTKLSELKATEADQKEIRLELANLEEGLNSEYKKCLTKDEEEGSQASWEGKFSALTTKLENLSTNAAAAADLKAFAAEQKTALDEFKTQKLEELVTGMKRSVDAERKKEPSYKIHEQIAEKYGYLPSAMVKVGLKPTDAKEMFVPKGYVENPEYMNAVMVAVPDDHKFRKQLKALLLADEKNATFTSESFPGIAFEHKEFGPREQREYGWRPWPPATTPAEYVKGFGALMDLICIKHPGCKLVFNITPDEKGEYPKLKTAKEINAQILLIMRLAQNEKKVPIELNPNLRAHLEELLRKAKDKKDKKLIESIEAVFKIELDSQRKATMDKLIGRDEKEWVNSIDMMKLRTQSDDGFLKSLKDGGIDVNTIGAKNDEDKLINPLPDDRRVEILRQIIPGYPEDKEGFTLANKRTLIQHELTTLAARMDEAEQASILIKAQINNLDNIADVNIEAEILNRGEDSHLDKLIDLKGTMDQNLNDLSARAAVLRNELRQLKNDVNAHSVGAPDDAYERAKQNLLTSIEENDRTASHLIDRGNKIKTNSANDISGFEEKQNGRLQKHQQARLGG